MNTNPLHHLKNIEKRRSEKALLRTMMNAETPCSVSLPRHRKKAKEVRKTVFAKSAARTHSVDQKVRKALHFAEKIEHDKDPLRHLGFLPKKKK